MKQWKTIVFAILIAIGLSGTAITAYFYNRQQSSAPAQVAATCVWVCSGEDNCGCSDNKDVNQNITYVDRESVSKVGSRCDADCQDSLNKTPPEVKGQIDKIAGTKFSGNAATGDTPTSDTIITITDLTPIPASNCPLDENTGLPFGQCFKTPSGGIIQVSNPLVGLNCDAVTLTCTATATTTVFHYSCPDGATPCNQNGTYNNSQMIDLNACGSQQIDVRGSTNGQQGFISYTGAPCTGTKSTPPPTPTPPPEDDGGSSACINIKIYKGDTLLRSADLKSLIAGNTITLALTATKATKVRFRINSTKAADWIETTNKNGAQEYTLSYTIPAGEKKFTIEGQSFNGKKWQ